MLIIFSSHFHFAVCCFHFRRHAFSCRVFTLFSRAIVFMFIAIRLMPLPSRLARFDAMMSPPLFILITTRHHATYDAAVTLDDSAD